MKNLKLITENIQGRIGVPILLWLLGVPGIFVIILWLLFFKD